MAAAPLRSGTAGIVVILAAAAGAPAAAIEFGLPIACTPGADCAVQHYVDRDPGGDAVDFRCGRQTNDGHDGTDFRVPSLKAMAAGVTVLAAAAGRVVALRDGMADVSVEAIDPASIAGRECGNGVLVEHGGGWSTQYCHMKNGSIRVKVGDAVTAGTPIGAVGLSGNTEFPHLHFKVARDGATVDPFAPEPLAGGPCAVAGDEAGSLWASAAKATLAYRPAFVLTVGFADQAVTMEEVESGALADKAIVADAPALVFYGLAIGLETGDRQRLAVTAPDGSSFVADEVAPVDRPKAQYFAFAGKKRSGGPWPAGIYRGRYAVIRDGAEIAAREATANVQP
jgi:hypothetical protein